jgi:hypothetical protein
LRSSVRLRYGDGIRREEEVVNPLSIGHLVTGPKLVTTLSKCLITQVFR